MSGLKKAGTRSTKADGAKTEKKLCDCAVRLFKAKGFDSTTIEEITKMAGVSKGTFYIYFKSKYSLLPPLIESLDIDYARYNESLAKEPDAMAAFWRFTNFVLDEMEVPRGLELLRVIYRAQITGDVVISPYISNDRILFKIYLDILERAKREGQIRKDLDCGFFSEHFVMAIRGMIFEWCTRAPNFNFRKEAISHFKFLVEGIGIVQAKRKSSSRKKESGGIPADEGKRQGLKVRTR